MTGTVDRREEDHVPQFHGRIDEKFAEWETDVKLWQAEYKEDDRVRLGPRLYRRGLHGQPKIIVLHSGKTSNASRTMAMENFLKSLDKRRWITTSTCDKERRKASRI